MAFVGAMIASAGVGLLFGIGWGLVALGVTTISEAVLMVDVQPRPERRRAPGGPTIPGR